MQALNKLGGTSQVTLVPSHQGILGNEKADRLVKLGTEMDPAEQTVGIPFVLGKRKIKEMLQLEHLNFWKETKWRAKKFMKKSNSARTKELAAMGKEKLRMGIGLLTGHLPLRAHLFNIGLIEQKLPTMWRGKQGVHFCVAVLCLPARDIDLTCF